MPVYGGSFAPPINLAKATEYRATLASAAAPVKAAALRLAAMVEKFHQVARAKTVGYVHSSGTGKVVRLDSAECDRLRDVVPDTAELNRIANVFEQIPAGSAAIRNAAFHLLWYAVELSKGREPITTDKL